jgi:hypothetical protein
MNKTFKLFLLILAIFSSFWGCKKDSTTDPADVRSQYTGTWLVQETGKKSTYPVIISNDPNNSVQVLISNFYNFSITPSAIVTSGTITVPSQSFNNNSITVYGSGTYSTNKITWIYYVNTVSTLDTVHSVYTKQ